MAHFLQAIQQILTTVVIPFKHMVTRYRFSDFEKPTFDRYPSVKILVVLDENPETLDRNRGDILTKDKKNMQNLARLCQNLQEEANKIE